MPGYTLEIKKDSKEHKKVLSEVVTRITFAEKEQNRRHEVWDRAERLVNAYVPETADDAKRRVARDDEGQPKYTTISIPYSYAILMAAHTYWSSVFLARSPVHQFSARHGEPEMSVQAVEALVAYQVEIGGALGVYYRWLYDAGKYGHGVIGEFWDEELNHYTQMVTLPGEGPTYVTREIGGYKGNRIYNVSPYDFLPDPRVQVHDFQSGEFCAVIRRLPWHHLVRRSKQGYYMNLDEIKGSVKRQVAEQDDLISPRPAKIDMIGGDGGRDEDKHPAWVEVYEFYVEVIPNEWGLGNMDMPEKWVFTVTADKALVIGAQPLGMMHCKFPFSVMQPEVEAYSMWTRGIPEILEPIQNTMNWLINSHYFNIRAIANGRFIADPSRLDLKQLEEDEPGFVLQVKPHAQGQDIRTMFQQLQAVDPTQNHFGEVQNMTQLGERMLGINDQMLGALGGGGRKTATEVRTSTGFGVNRLKTTSEYMSAMAFAPHAQKLVQNSQQLYSDPIKVKLTGDLAKMAQSNHLRVSPEDIAGFFDFVPVDGSLPIDRFAQATLWKDIMGQMRQFPQVMNEFDMAKIFTWVAGLAGIKNIDQFRVQVVPDDMIGNQADRGNVIPYQGPSAEGARGPGTQTNNAQTPNVGVGLPQA